MTDDERRSYANLLLLCPNCHNLVDDLEAEAHPVDRLEEIKAQHEQRMEHASYWAQDVALEKYAARLLAAQFGIISPQLASERDREETGAGSNPYPAKEGDWEDYGSA